MNDQIFDPGALKHRMTLEEPDDTLDGAGGALREWVTADEFWAELRPVSARLGIGNASAEQRVTHELHYRAGPELTTVHRLRFGTRIFTILAVRDATPDGARKLALIEEIKP